MYWNAVACHLNHMFIFYRPPRTDRPRERDGSRSSAIDSDDINRRSRYPDSQQLFVGNLPHNIADKELKTYFESKLSVVDSIFQFG